MNDAASPAKLVHLAFNLQCILVPLTAIMPMRTLQPSVKESHKYKQILASVRAVGLVEPPAVVPDQQHPGHYLLLDGHLRIEALKDLERTEVECLVASDDEAFTYNKRINRLASVQEHRMIVRALERGVSEERIAEALGIDPTSVQRRFRLLDGICAEAVELLKDTHCPMAVFDTLKRMVPLRQIDAAELIVGQNNFSLKFAQTLLAATPEDQLVAPRRRPPARPKATSEHLARLERELAVLQAQVKSVEDDLGADNLDLTVAKGYVAKLLRNPRVERWLDAHRPEYLSEFRRIAEMEMISA